MTKAEIFLVVLTRAVAITSGLLVIELIKYKNLKPKK